MFFIPTIAVGPIHRAPAFIADLKESGWNAGLISEGLQRIVYGYAKVAILATFLLPHAINYLRTLLASSDGAAAVYLEIVENGFNIYFLFSGYSDIAIGFALLLGYRVIENFDSPYLKKNVADFWRSWHISLTSWTRDYVYMPMLAVTRSPRVAIIMTFLVIGLWHEINLQYVLWGMWHAVGIIIWREYSRIKRKLFGAAGNPPSGGAIAALKNSLAITLTVHYFFLSTIIVRSSNLHEAAGKFRTLFFFWW